jgi:hypothetical protein
MNDKNTQVIEWTVNDQAIAEVAEQCKDIDAYKDLDEAKQAKKGLTKMRTALSEAHKETKAEALAFGRKVDAEKNRLLAKIREIEDPISLQLDEIKNAEARKEQERLEAIEEAILRIEAYANDRYSLTLDQLRERQKNLGELEITDEVYQEQTERAALLKQDAGMKLDLAIKAEQENIQKEAEAAEQAEENRKLREQVEAMQAEQRKKDEAEAAERAKREAQARKESEAREAEARARAEQAEKEARKLREEAAEKERQEQQEREAREAAERQLAQAPDREKLLAFADRVDDLLTLPPTLATDPANEILRQAKAMLIEVAYDIRKSVEEMK